MTDATPVEIVLDLLEYKDRLKSPSDYLGFCNRLSNSLQGNKLEVGKTHILESPQNGKIGLTVISLPLSFSVVTKNTVFAVHSVLEPPDLRYKCTVCRSYGPFRCATANCRKRLCDQHAVILDGNMRAYCPDHAPKCKGSGAKATFWCDGPRCHGRSAWSDAYRVRHPNDPDHWYCPDCYAQEFPPCSVYGCQDTGTIRCEFTDVASGRNCNRSLCNVHVRRWQIYGPHRLGVALCSDHANVKRHSELEILNQMVAVTTTRRLSLHKRHRRNQRQDFVSLPSLMSFRHIFINAKNKVISPGEIDRRLDRLELELRNSRDRFSQNMAKTIQQSNHRRKRELDSFDTEQQKGQVIFDRLLEKLSMNGESVLVENIRFSDYRPRHNLLFVYLDQQYRGRLIGSKGSKIIPLQEYLGVRIKFEEK